MADFGFTYTDNTNDTGQGLEAPPHPTQEALNQRQIPCLYTNADCFPNKLAEFRDRVHTLDPQPLIIAITEVKPKLARYTVTEAELQLRDYDLFSCNLDTAEGRGIVMYTHSSLRATLEQPEGNFKEQLWVKIGDELLMGCLYRSPNSTAENNVLLNTVIRDRAVHASHLLLCGDYNYRNIDWESMSTTAADDEAAEFLAAVQDVYLYQHVTEPTRCRGQDQPSVLDLLLTPEEGMVTDVVYGAPLGRSDHCTLTFTYNGYTPDPAVPQPKHMYDRGNYAQMERDLDVDWDTVFMDCPDDPNRQYELFTSRLSESAESNIPLKTRRTAGKPHVGRELKAAIRSKDRAWTRLMEARSEERKVAYNRARNKVRNMSRRIKRQRENDIADQAKSCPKKFWNYARSKLKTRTGVSELRTPAADGTDRVAKTDQEKAEALSSFFASVFTVEPDGPVPEPVQRDITSPFETPDITTEQVRKQLQALDTSKAMGPDGVHPRVLRELSSVLAIPLRIIFQTSMRTGIVPQSWKEANVTPIFKKGERAHPSNYRPVSLTSIVCKVMERIVRDWIITIMDHMYRNHLLYDRQFGFIPGRSTTLQLLSVFDEWSKVLDEGGQVDVVYLDFRKAFDSVPHRRLIAKLESYGIDPVVCTWIEAFITNRRQRVGVQGSFSDWADVTSGIPQGSVLGPVNFVMYINDLPEEILSLLYLFADDVKLFRRIASLADSRLLQADLDRLEAWAYLWLLFYHPDKCLSMAVHAGDQPAIQSTYSVADSQIKTTLQEKDLGVTTDSKLNFENHIHNIAARANRIMGMIRRSYTYLSVKNFPLLFKGLVRPHLEYAQAAWQPYKLKDIDTLERVQRRATKQVQGLRDMTYAARLKTLGLTTLAYRRLRGDLIEVYKILHGHYDTRVRQNILQLSNNHRTRGHPLKLEKHHCRRNVRLHSFGHRVVSWWNNLPADVVTAPSLRCFERRLDKHWEHNPTKYETRPEQRAGHIGR